MSNEHRLGPPNIHHDWDGSRTPAVRVRPDDVVHFDLPITGEGQVSETSTVDEVMWDFDTIYNLAGPVFVEGAEAGDTLEVEVLALTTGPWGWTTFMPELGLLAEDFPEPFLKILDLRGGVAATIAPGIEVPLDPFLGTMGVATDEPGGHSPFPPHRGGGNVDCRHLVVGSTLWLPIWCEGALFSCGDAHGAQGDGEVCVSAIECAMEATLRFRLHKRSIPGPAFHVPRAVGDPGPHYGTMGIDADLMQGAKTAVRNMIHWLVAEHGLTREDAYVLCSLAGDLRIHEIVDAGVWNVGMVMPLSVFARPAP
jgi:acetamidase/formamidase